VAPTIESFSARASAGSVAPTNISFVALALACGGTRYRTKFDQSNGLTTPECGPTFATDKCADALGRHNPSVSPSCPPGVSATESPNGSVTVSGLSGCSVTDFIVKCGQCCAGPNMAGEPTAASGGSITFTQCTSVCADCTSHPPC
jgi:hypothetical protein